MKLRAKDALAYGRNLLDTLFSKSDQKSGILFASNRSTKPALDIERATLLIGKPLKFSGLILYTHFIFTGLVKQKFGQENFSTNYSSLIQILNQKCRDAKV